MATKWTNEQLDAINKRGCNVIVSAGAGSGKTAVLTQRITTLLKENIKASELLVLTFTNAAAANMKKKIIEKMQRDELLKNRIDEVDNAYITTFDSFSLSIVKKYHYRLGLSSNISIIEGGIINVFKRKIIDELFDKYYENETEDFHKLLYDLTLKNDNQIKKALLTVANKLDLRVDRDNYLKEYISNNYNEKIFNQYLEEYTNLLLEKISYIKDNFNKLSSFLNENQILKYQEKLNDLFQATNYDEIRRFVFFDKLPVIMKLDDEAKIYKDEIKQLIEEIRELSIYPNQEYIKEGFFSTNKYCQIIIELLQKYYMELEHFKKVKECFEFTDIAKMSIDLVKNNLDICQELKKSFKEILLDEYQDTNDLQETFINYISQNNVYMVGDIKQSIYRFRNANPKIFKDKYDKYKNNENGYKIDLNKNFRSTRQVLNIINDIYCKVMDDDIGNANYKVEHQMNFGLKKYDEFNQNGKIKYLTYDNFEKKYKNNEIDMFIVLKDIQEKIANKTMVYDSNLEKERPCEYKDFAILSYSSSNFETIKKLLEYHHIPAVINKNEEVGNSVVVPLIVEIITMINQDIKSDYNVEFFKAFYSVSRSFLLNLSDEYLFDVLSNNLFKETKLYEIIHKYSQNLNDYTLSMLVKSIIEQFDITNKLTLIGNINANLTRIEYLINISSSMEKMDMNIEDFVNYIEEIFENNEKLEFANSGVEDNKVKIMTIHKSKGLEFPITYFIDNHKLFNNDEFKDKIIYDEKYGIITPFNFQGEEQNINFLLMKNKNKIDSISEQIRVQYVALTRAKEQIIIICPSKKNSVKKVASLEVVNNNIRRKYNSYQSIYESVLFVFDNIKECINIGELQIKDDYNLTSKVNYNELIKPTKEKITILENKLDSKEISSIHASKGIKSLQEKETLEAMEYGSYIHKLFESIDFKKPHFEGLNNIEKKYVNNFLKLPIFQDINNGKICKENEFIIENEKEKIHGIIDLMIVYDTHIDIIDYKLKHTEDENYLKQLQIYANYILNKTHKKVDTYLYSIMDNKLKKVGDINA